MKSLLLPLALALATTAAAHADGHFERTLRVSGEPDLYVTNGSGEIRIHPGADGQIHIAARVRASWSAFGDIDGRVQKIVDNPPIVQEGNTIKVGQIPNAGNLLNNISIEYDITAPASVALNLRSGSGDVDVDGVGRFLTASSGSGSVRAHGIHGPAELQSGSGDLEIEEKADADVKARTGSGSIRVHNFSGAFTARSGSGDIEADGRLNRASSLFTGSGSIRLHLTQDSHFNLEAATGSGAVRLHMPGVMNTDTESSRHHLTTAVNGGGAPLSIHTGSGDIEIGPR